jgi:hypothetical protein
MQDIKYHIYDNYEPLILTFQTQGILKSEVEIIPIVFSRTSTFNVKEIVKLLSFKEEPPDVLAFNQLPTTAKKRTFYSMYMHKSSSPTYRKTPENPHHKDKEGYSHLNRTIENL